LALTSVAATHTRRSGTGIPLVEPEYFHLLEEAVECQRRAGTPLDLALALNLLAIQCTKDLSGVSQSVPFLVEAMDIGEGLGIRYISLIRLNLSIRLAILGDFAEADRIVRQATQGYRRLPTQFRQVVMYLANVICAIETAGDQVLAARLAGALDNLFPVDVESHQFDWSPTERWLRAEDLRRLEDSMDPADFTRSYAEGSRLRIEEVMEMCLRRQ
jgi:hypothetical protein